MRKQWFEVDSRGLAEIAKRRGVAFVVTEPVQNAWDEDVTRVEVELEAIPGVPKTRLTVRDDSPDGFRDIADSYMMFRQSYKLANPEQRGRFNLGEKLILALADEAEVSSTTGTVRFTRGGRRRTARRTARGSVLTATLRMTRAELDEALASVRTLIPPDGVATVVNGVELPARRPIAEVERTLETELRGEEGGFQYTRRRTRLLVYEPLPGETPHLYEMGIPVDELSCPWHVSVCQKVPLSVDRGSVRQGYRWSVQTHVAEAMAERMSEEQAREEWVASAIATTDDDATVRELVRRRFGKAVTYDPSSPESAKRAIDAGYHVVRGGEMSKAAWASVRRAKALRPAGQVFRVGVDVHPDGARPVPRGEWTEPMERFARYAQDFSAHVLGDDYAAGLAVNFYRMPGSDALAFCGGGEIGLNLSRGGDSLLARMGREELDRLLIHECAHVKEGDHLTDAFYEECCRIGAVLRNFYDWP